MSYVDLEPKPRREDTTLKYREIKSGRKIRRSRSPKRFNNSKKTHKRFHEQERRWKSSDTIAHEFHQAKIDYDEEEWENYAIAMEELERDLSNLRCRCDECEAASRNTRYGAHYW